MMSTTPTEIANAFQALGKDTHSLEVIEKMIVTQRQEAKKKPKRKRKNVKK